MNKIKIDINQEKKIITIDILEDINKDNMRFYIEQIDSKIKRLSYSSKVNLNEWRFNIYTCHMIINKAELEGIEQLLDYCTSLDFKMIDIITAKPQKKYREWIDGIIQRYFTDYHVKTLATNNMFKFNFL